MPTLTRAPVVAPAHARADTHTGARGVFAMSTEPGHEQTTQELEIQSIHKLNTAVYISMPSLWKDLLMLIDLELSLRT